MLYSKSITFRTIIINIKQQQQQYMDIQMSWQSFLNFHKIWLIVFSKFTNCVSCWFPLLVVFFPLVFLDLSIFKRKSNKSPGILTCVLCAKPGVIWYFEPHGKLNPGSIYLWYFDPGFNFPYGILTPGSIFCHCILNPLMVNWSPPHFYQKIGVHNTIREGLIYHR